MTPIADRAVLVRFADAMDDTAHQAVLALDHALAADPCTGLVESVPAFVSLLVTFNPGLTDHPTTMAHLASLLSRPAPPPKPPTGHTVQVCYDPDLAPDLAEVAAQTGLPPEAVIAQHLAGSYRVAMYGFAPGYAYLSGVPDPIRLPRKSAAIRGIPAGSVIIAAGQCLVTTLTMPTGWWIIGRSPTQILRDQAARPFLFDVGDAVQFQRITRAEFDRLAR